MSNDDRQIGIDAIDALIDDVAREMTSAPAKEGLARRVAARIGEMEAGTAQAPRTWGRTWLLASTAATCVLGLALFVARETREPAAIPPAVAVRSVEPAGLVGPVRPKPDVTLATPATSATTTAPTMPRSTRAAAVQPASPKLEPLTLAPIVFDKVDVSPLVVVMPIEISTIAIERIEISAMP